MKKNLIKLIGLIYIKVLLPLVRIVNTKISSEIPKFEINSRNIQNTKLLVDRSELLNMLPKNGTVAEIGVDEGDFSELILKITNPHKLHLIDFWGSKRYNQEKREKVEKKFKEEIVNSVVEINLGLSTQVAGIFPDCYFDWIYIDTDHSYKTTITELELYKNKVKENGIIAGHDFILGNWNDVVRYGVIEAVYEFCTKYNWEILYITAELNNNPSFAIRRMYS